MTWLTPVVQIFWTRLSRKFANAACVVFSPLSVCFSVFQLCFGVGSSEIRRQFEKKQQQRNVVLAVVAADQVMYSVWRLKQRSLNQTSWLSWVFSVTPSSCISLVSCCGSGPIKLTASQSGQQCNKWTDSSWAWVVGRLKKW